MDVRAELVDELNHLLTEPFSLKINRKFFTGRCFAPGVYSTNVEN